MKAIEPKRRPVLYRSANRTTAFLRQCAVVSAVLLASAACDAPKANSAADSTSDTPEPEPAVVSTAPAGAVTERGYDALRTGMPFAEANDSLRGALKATAGANLAECAYVTWEGGPEGLAIMVSEGKIARIEVKSATIPTAAGARVGDNEEDVLRLYPGRVAVTPHKYTDGHYLTVRSANADDTLHFLIFETEQNKVTRYRAGIMPAVAFVEGCS